MKRVIVSMLLALAGVAQAQDAEGYDPVILTSCLDQRPGVGREDCIGLAANRCLWSETGSSTVGVGICYGSELAQWDARLNDIYAQAVEQAKEMDADHQAFNSNLPLIEEELRAMQRAWITFRDAACTYDAAQWGGGTGAGPSSTACLMRLTAQQVLFLEDHLQ